MSDIFNYYLNTDTLNAVYEHYVRHRDNCLIIFPNHRSCRDFKSIILERNDNIIMPQILSVTDLFSCEVKEENILLYLYHNARSIPFLHLCNLSEVICHTIKAIVLNEINCEELISKVPNDLRDSWQELYDIISPFFDLIHKYKQNLEQQKHVAQKLIKSHYVIAVGLTPAHKTEINFLKDIILLEKATIILSNLQSPIVQQIYNGITDLSAIHSVIHEFRKQAGRIAVFQSENDEARAVAYSIRKSVAEQRNVVIVSRSQNFVKRLKSELLRWNIIPDDSFGEKLIDTAHGQLCALVADIISNRFDFYSVINLFKTVPSLLEEIYKVETDIRRRDIAPKKFLNCMSLCHCSKKLCDLISNFSNVFHTFADHKNIREWIDFTTNVIQILHPEYRNIFSNSQFYITKCGDIIVHADDFAKLLRTKLLQTTTRCAYGYTPGVVLVGAIEAQLLCADSYIITNANQEDWIINNQENLFLTKPLCKELGIPTTDEQNLFLTAIFSKIVAQPNVLITRSIGNEKKNPHTMIPSFERSTQLEKYARYMIYSPHEGAYAASPCPYIEYRPTILSVSDIRTLVQNPYVFYAKKILRLTELGAIGHGFQGKFIHRLLDTCVRNNIHTFAEMQDACTEMLKSNQLNISDIGLMAFRLHQIFNTFDITMSDDSKTYSEIDGACDIQISDTYALKIKCRADRIIEKDGKLSIIDYKTYKAYKSEKEITETFLEPQLALEALIAIKGGFSVQNNSVESMQFWEIRSLCQKQIMADTEEDVAQIANNVEQCVRNLIMSKRGYKLNPNSEYDDAYKHLARMKEWHYG